jgi:type IV pilus assembly protein PilQ
MTRHNISATIVAATLLLGVTGATTAAPPLGGNGPEVGAAASVTALSVMPGSGRAEVVISISGDVDLMDFALDNGKRIVVDIKGATLGFTPKGYDNVQRAGISNIRFSQFSKEVVRVVVVLDSPREYTVVKGERDIRVSVEGPSEFTPWSTQAQASQQGQQGQQGRPVVTNASVNTNPPPRDSASRPPVRNANTNPRVEQLPLVPEQQGRAQGGMSRISIAFHDADIRDVVVAFADHSGKTIVVGPAVTGTVRATIVDQPWDVALKSILDGYGLAAVEDSLGIIRVDSYANLAALAAVEPMFTRVIQVNYTRAEVMAGTVRSLLGAGCGGPAPSAQQQAAGAAGGGAPPAAGGGGMSVTCNARGSVSHDEKTNSVIVTETAARLEEIQGYIRDLDVRTPQITIKAKIITVDRTGTDQLGLAYDLGSANTFSNAIITRSGTSGENRINLSGDGFAGVANSARSFKGNTSLALIHNMVLGGFNLTTFLDALSSVNLTDVQAEPSTTTVDNRQAELFSGNQVPYLLTPPIPAGTLQAVAPQIAQAQIGITLRVTPHVTANRQILLDVFAEQQTLQEITVAGPNTTRRTTTNQVLVNDGETAVIGGLTQTQVVRQRSGIPLLMDLPGVGRLFSQTSSIERKQDLLILITPIIVDEGQVVGGQKRP